jgi:hypothetical protein
LPDRLLGTLPVQPHLGKYFRSRIAQIKTISAAVSSHQEGRLAIVTDAGRDAMDAKARSSMRSFSRTAKTCGPDASTLASSWRRSFPLMTVTTKPDHREERAISRKTIA